MTTHKGGIVYKYVAESTPETDDNECFPPNSRIAVATRTQPTEADVYNAFSGFGIIEYIKIVIKRPMSFVKFAKASSAELAIENAEQIQIGGVPPKVFMAETRAEQGKTLLQARSTNPDDIPLRSRLFVALSNVDVPAEALEPLFSVFPGFVSLKKVERQAIAFVKYALASQAAVAMESILETGSPDIKNILPAEAKGAKPLAVVPGALSAAPSPRGRALVPQGYPLLPLPVLSGKGGKSPRGQHIRDSPPCQRLFIVTGPHLYHHDLEAAIGHLPGLEFLDVKISPAGTPKGFAYATFSSTDAATSAMAYIDHLDVNGVELKAVFAQERTGAPPSSVAPASLAQPARRPLRPALAPHPAGAIEINDDIPRGPDGLDPDQPPGSRVFYVLGPGCVISEDNLISLFRRYPGLQYVQSGGAGKGFGFAKYDNPASAQEAIDNLHMKQLGEGTLKVVHALPSSERGPQKRPREF